ncbi:alpha/beta fold hydrolase [Aquabacterium sp. A3]|uniref:alpha/beta fold hydrolase n=1 Tax=Aquabacterium sp. A3 TaxID=3132829 RepID=UPI00311A26CF
MPTLPFQRLTVQGPDGVLAVRRWGRRDRPVVLCVHGYPDNSSKWEAVATWLANDYQVVAYDVRGAGQSFKPTATQAYALARLTEDFRAVIDAVSPNAPVHLVGHDWGSVQCWEFVTDPSLKGRIASYTSCSGPCLDHVGHWMRDRLRQPSLRGMGQMGLQLIKSWYVYLFHLPWVPELLWRAVLGRQWHLVMRWLERTPVPPRDGQADDGRFGVNLYRANFLPRLMHPGQRVAHAPVQVLVPTGDRFVSPSLSENLDRWAPSLQRHELKAGHWITLKQPELFAQAVRQFISA